MGFHPRWEPPDAGLEDPKPSKQLSVLPTPRVGFGAAQDGSQPEKW